MNFGNPFRPARYRKIALTATALLAAALGTAYSQIAWSSDFESLDVNTPSALPGTWRTDSIQLVVGAGMDTMLLQFGFSATSSLNVASGVFYDNLSFGIAPATPPALFAITQITKSGNEVNVSFPTENGFNYDLPKSTDGMVTFDPVPAQPAIPGVGTLKTATDNAATESSAFYRIRRLA